MIIRLAISLLVTLGAHAAHAQGTITLKPVVRTEIGAALTLGEIAELTGDAEAFGEVMVMDDPASEAGADHRLSVSLDDVRQLLKERAPQQAGRLSYSGESCRIILRPKQKPVIERTPDASVVQKANLGLTVRDHVEAKLVQTLGVPMERLELTFDETDAPLLSSATRGWTVVVEPTGSSSRMPMRITMYDERGEIRDASIRVGVRILRDVVRTTRAMRRGETLTNDDYETDQAWLAPDIAHIEPSEAGTIRLKRSTGAGEMLTDGHAERAEVIGLGDIVSVHAISGTIVMRTEARALESGRIGDTIELESLQTNGRFSAEVKAPGRVVAIAQARPLGARTR